MSLVTFDGPNKLIIVNPGVRSLNVRVDLYSTWKEWVVLGDNTKYLPAFSVIGGDEIGGGRFLGATFFIENGWKIRPAEESHTLTVEGNLYGRGGVDPFTSTLGNFNVRINSTVSNIIDQVSTSGGSTGPTASQIASAVRLELNPELAKINTHLTADNFDMLLKIYQLYGLDPTQPLVVTRTERRAGTAIVQSITGDSNSTTVTRV